jgi:hypothetical protein
MVLPLIALPRGWANWKKYTYPKLDVNNTGNSIFEGFKAIRQKMVEI